MGLDITIYKFNNSGECEYTINEDVKNRLTEIGADKFIQQMEHEYYDLEKAGVTSERYEWRGTSFGEKCIDSYTDKQHPLYEVYKKYFSGNENYYALHGITKEQAEAKECELIEAGVIELAKANGFKDEVISKSDKEDVYDFSNLSGFMYKAIEVEFDMDEYPTFKRMDDVIKGDEIGYQRKGMNSRFYDEYKGGDYFVFKKERLEYLCENCVVEDTKEYFREHIINKFVEGECFVTFDR